jgi:hypothetical protein
MAVVARMLGGQRSASGRSSSRHSLTRSASLDGDENRALLARINATGEAFLSDTTLDGCFVLRLAVGHHRTTEADVRRVWELLQEV